LASEFDNIFYNESKIELLDSGVFYFYEGFERLQAAREILDHIPIWGIIIIK
jgi:deoxyribonuclease-1-like protein